MMPSRYMGVVMLLKAAAVALVAAAGVVLPAAAQVSGAGPSEPPPPGFSGVQYVDSRGCAYVRAGHGGQVTWVRRIGTDRRPMCGLQPTRVTMERARAALAAEAAAPAAPPVAAPPPPPVAAAAPAPARAAPPPPAPPVARPAAPAPGCPARAPVAQRFELVGGGSVVLCLEPGVTISGARPGDAPRAGAPGPGAALTAPRGGMAPMATAADPRVPAVVLPSGYKMAWRDDRLNPRRGVGTPDGEARMRAIWTDTVPMALHVDTPRDGLIPPVFRPVEPRVTVAARTPEPAAPMARVSTRTPVAAAPLPVPAGAAWVQVGSFSMPQNARNAEARLAALGLPVRTGRATVRGTAVEVVRAGPFATAAEAQAALAAARGAGFGDAILRR